MIQAKLLAEQIDGSRDWTLKLIADLQGDEWGFAPRPGLAHPLWLCGHLAVAQHLIVHVRCLGRNVLDGDFIKHFPIGAPVKSVTEHDYPPVKAVLAKMKEVHQKTLEAVRSMSDELLAEPAFQQRPVHRGG